jgi:hypothetical protein
MPPPLTIQAIRAARAAAQQDYYEGALDRLEQRAASLSDPTGHTNTINIPPPPAVLSVVSWNVQTFEAGKSLGNPFVNKVINRVLAALDADVCVLLESRADSYVNMNAIETGFAGGSGWKQVAEEADQEDEDEEPDLGSDMGASSSTPVEDDEEEVSGSPTDGGEPLTYAQNVSDMTGKRWAPPKVIHVYHATVASRCRDLKDLTRIRTLTDKLAGKGKLTKKEESTLLALTKKRDKNLLADPKHYDAVKSPEPGMKTFASSYNYQPKLNKKLCVAADMPVQAWKATLLQEEFKPIRDYYELRRTEDDWTEQTLAWDADISSVPPAQNWRFLLRLRPCPGCGKSLGSGDCGVCEDYGAYTTALANLREAVDDVTFFMCTCQESYSILLRQETEVLASSAQGQWLQGKLVSVKANAAELLMRAPDVRDTTHGKITIKAGALLGYQDAKIRFYGRCPYLLPIELWLPYHDVSHKLYMVAFHGPFGDSDKAGVALRAAAMRELMNAGVGSGSKLGDEKDVLILGDFNLDWAPDAPKPDSYQQIANALYTDFDKAGLKPLIGGGVATSLISIHGSAKWRDVAPTIESYTSSAYDNCFLRGDDVRAHVVQAAVVDVISWIEDNLAEFPLPADDPQHGKLGALPAKTQAFYIYRKYVSDHLPIVCDILVAPMTARMMHFAREARAEADRKAQRRIREQGSALTRTSNVPQFDVRYVFESVIGIDPTDEVADSYTSVNDDVGPGRTGTFVGTVDSHQDDHLVLRCAPFFGHRAWLSWRPDARPKQIAMILRAYPPGTRMKWVVRNHRPIG